ncbi:hypothetical protein NBRC116583_08350 [Arenicella sp. 4NH20-0111]|uniref:hypothetical protein n=1 Tax=Arenicella sp. 4NH20-0111 TaxID=3127648 RepID=UPI0031025F01
MNNDVKVQVPMWYWLIAIIALLWYLMDMSAFSMRVFMLEDMIEAMPDEQQALYLGMPNWVNTVFAIEVVGGVLGSLCLLLKKKWALVFFGMSIVGVLAQTSYVYFLSDALSVLGVSAKIMPMVAISIGVGLIFFARHSVMMSWLK